MQFFSNRNNNSLAQYLDNKMSSILKTDNLVVKSHFLLSACCMYSKPPKPILIVLLSDIKSNDELNYQILEFLKGELINNV